MSRSSPPPSVTAQRVPRSDRPDASRRRRLGPRVASFVRWLHTYLSMFSLATLLFFSVTGITLNHPTWFFAGVARNAEYEGQVDTDWVRLRDAGDPDSDPSAGVAKLEVVEHLRQSHGIQGALAGFTADEYECVVTFKGPGYSADAFIDRESGDYQLTEVRHGLVALINDLHKGRDTGPAWSWVIDISAALMTVVSLSGLVLLFYIKRRRALGLATALLGTVVLALAFVLGVP